MKPPNQQKPTHWFPSFAGLFRRATSWRRLRLAFFGLVCLVTLIALAYAQQNWSASRAEAHYRQQLEAKGETLDYQKFIPAPVPDDQNFAETKFFAPLFDFLPGTQRPRDTNAWQQTLDFNREIPSVHESGNWLTGDKLDLKAWAGALVKKEERTKGEGTGATLAFASPEQAAREVLRGLSRYEPVLEQLRRASHRRYCRFNVSYQFENPAAILLPHLAIIKGVCHILEVRSVAELTLGQVDAAAKDVTLALYLTEAVRHEPLLISQLVRIADLRLSLQPVWEGLVEHKWSGDQLRQWQAQLEQMDLLGALRFTLEAERAWGDRIIDWIESLPGGQRLSRFGELTSNPQSQWWGGLVFRLAPRGWFDWEKLNYNRLFEERVLPGYDPRSRQIKPDVVEAGQQYLTTVVAQQQAMVRHHLVFARLLLPAVPRVFQRFGTSQTLVDQAVLACALERYRLAHGTYPDALDALVPSWIKKLPTDVISGQPLKYHRTADGSFQLYSVGWNQNDDGGHIAFKKSTTRALLPTEGDWVWPVLQK